jgi:hypothetical protein
MFDLGGMRDPHDENKRDFRLGGTLYAFMLRWLWGPLSRDITLVHDKLRDSGCAAWMDEVLVAARVPAESDLQRAVAAVQKLLDQV